ncbi:MAG TPA: cell wall hydrolase [Caulobacteraceae bacterium]
MRRGLAALLAGALALAGCATPYLHRGDGREAGVAAVARGFSPHALARVSADMDPAMLALAERHVPGRKREDLWGRTPGWAVLDLVTLPTLSVADVRTLNALKPSMGVATPARPFVLKANAEDSAQALKCLTQAVYYEAANEPLKGQQAVAQTVLNRLRHPGYPKSVCGVVFEGAMRTAGCQFSFTCDGSLRRAPAPGPWARAQAVAKAALGGYVAREVGTATHYHADYVSPYWAPTLLKIRRIGAHIFYRWTGPAGELKAFNGKYGGHELNLTRAVLRGIDERIQGSKLLGQDGQMAAPVRPTQTVTLGAGDEARTYVITVDETGARQAQAPGALSPTRRAPTAEEIARINARLKVIDAEDKQVRPLDIPPAYTNDLPIGDGWQP